MKTLISIRTVTLKPEIKSIRNQVGLLNLKNRIENVIKDTVPGVREKVMTDEF